MPIITLEEILADAHQNRYAVGMFDVHNLEMTNAVIQAAQAEKSPVIIALAQVHAPSVSILEDIAHMMVHAAKRATVPVCVHFDHGTKLDYCLRALHYGFSSIMYDGSSLPFEENIKNVTEAVRMAKVFGASVEGELGRIGGGEGGIEDGQEMLYTNPAKAREYVERTGVHGLAVSIGTCHGAYLSEPRLDFNRLEAIKKETAVPLVLHGGSGLSDLDFQNCIRFGISKINIYTEIAETAMARIHYEMEKFGFSTPSFASTISSPSISPRLPKNKISYTHLLSLITEDMKKAVAKKLQLFGSTGKASGILKKTGHAAGF